MNDSLADAAEDSLPLSREQSILQDFHTSTVHRDSRKLGFIYPRQGPPTSNFSGKIPSSTQLQSFNASAYTGNHELCGLPLTKNCSEDESASVPPSSHRGKGYTNEKDVDMFITPGFYVSVVLGFTFGFWGFVGPLLLRSSWRYSYFMFLDKMKDWTSVTIAVNMARLQRKLRG
ncbi:hypothetical protein LguiA_029727 [Lonicera macranthoides]